MPPLSPQVFAILRSLVEERTGIHYGLDEAPLLADKLATHLESTGFESPLDYYYALRYDDPDGVAFDALVAALVVNESYFFREPEQLTYIVDHVVVPRVRAGRRVRLWSAACAQGEEPLTLAMLLADRGVLDAVEIVASDISDRALARARGGVYGPRALRSPPALAYRFLTPEDGRYLVDPEIHARVRFLRLNLVDRAAIAALGSFDVILCRNVLIYFSDAIIGRVVESLAGALVPGGYLFVGVSESLLRFGTDLLCEEHHGVFHYRRHD